MRLDMFTFHMFPQPSLVLGGPQTIHTLPQVTRFTHFLCYLSLHIYRKNLELFISTAFMKLAFVLMPGIFGRAELRAERTRVTLRLYMLCLNVFPQPGLVLGSPHAVHTLPQVAKFAHF